MNWRILAAGVIPAVVLAMPASAQVHTHEPTADATHPGHGRMSMFDFGGGWMVPLAPETTHLIKDMTVAQVQKGYILYIGAGAVAAGGIISLFRSLPVIWSGLKGGLADLRGSKAAAANASNGLLRATTCHSFQQTAEIELGVRCVETLALMVPC